MSTEEAGKKPAAILSSLARITSSGRFIREVDGLRFVAIAFVVLYHLATYIKSRAPAVQSDPLYFLLSRGGFGVQLFFVISGFILALPFAERWLEGAPMPGLGRYYARRLVRLEPPYIINLLLLSAAMVLLGRIEGEKLWPHLVASVFYVHNAVYRAWSPINPVAWSLEIEVQFYLLAPFLSRVFALPNAGVRRSLLVAAIGLSTWGAQSLAATAHAWLWLTLAGQLQYFLLGFLLADWYVLERRLPKPPELRWDLVGAIGWGAMGAVLVSDRPSQFLILPSMLLAYMAAFRGRILNAFLGLPWLTTVGGMCYTIYLYHYRFIAELGRFTWSAYRESWPFWQNYLLQLGLMLVPLLAVGVFFFAVVERPFMRLCRARRA